ncbi:MAG: hypothetical protein ABEK04_00220 [Candidatus Nanohalobium sp.]
MRDIYEKAVKEADMWLSMGQGLVLQGLESYPEKFEMVTPFENIPGDVFSQYLNPYEGDKFVHFGAFYGGSKLTMKGMEKYLDEPSDEALLAGAFIATTLVGGSVEYLDPYFDMADMAADYAGWYLAAEDELDKGPTERAYQGIKGAAGDFRNSNYE